METKHSQLYAYINLHSSPINIYINGPFGNVHAHKFN